MAGRLHEESDERRTDLVCSHCGYGVARPTPPRRCPMCQTRDAWVRARYGARSIYGRKSIGVPRGASRSSASATELATRTHP